MNLETDHIDLLRRLDDCVHEVEDRYGHSDTVHRLSEINQELQASFRALERAQARVRDLNNEFYTRWGRF